MTVLSQKYVWPTVDTQAVAHTQDISLGNFLVLNGNLSDPFTPNSISFLKAGFIRTVSISSTNNLSGSTFTVSGTQNGDNISEDITGPNNATVFGLVAFDVITSITVDQNSNGVQVGTGDKGYLPMMQVNLYGEGALLNYGIHAVPDGVTYEIFRSLYSVFENNMTIKTQQDRGYWVARADGPQTDAFIYDSQSISIANYILVEIQSTDQNPGTLEVIYKQTS